MTRTSRQRADILLVEHGHFDSRERARKSIMAGEVRVGADRIVAKPAETWDCNTQFTVTHRHQFVSRGAQKLIEAFDAHVGSAEGCTALDLGASTGGFTDLMLQRGAARVFAVDVGHGQLHYRLRRDPRVVCLEKVNARYITTAIVPDPVHLVTADLSFISLTKVLPAIPPLLAPDAVIMLLIKPQFEAERNEVGKGGVVRSDETRQRAVCKIREFAESTLGWHTLAVCQSPLKGAKGNIEFVAVFLAR